MNAEETIKELLKSARITVNGSEPSDIQVHDKRLYERVLIDGTLAAGESYMDGWWSAQRMDETFEKALRGNLKAHPIFARAFWLAIKARFLNPQSITRSRKVGREHYDIGNDLYQAMLDPYLVYSCGYWKNAHSLDEAQEHKLDLICKKIRLKGGERVLDIGCGWGGFMKYAVEHYGAECVGLTISAEQKKLGEEICQGLPIQFRTEDYRVFKTQEKFDHVVSVGMFEHVGPKNYEDFFKMVRSILKDDGLFLLHTIGFNYSGSAPDQWIERYIFPGGALPSMAQISTAVEKKFVIEDWHNFGTDYDKTLMAWYVNFKRAWSDLQERYGERFYRMWEFYLLSMAANFRVRRTQLWQVVLSPKGVPGGYTSVR